MDELETIMLTEIRQRQIPYDFSHMWNKKQKRQANEQKQNR